MFKRNAIAVLLAASLPLAAHAADSYTIDPPHTFPRFMINHLGFSTMEGRFDKTSGKITLDRAAKNGSVDIAIDARRISSTPSSFPPSPTRRIRSSSRATLRPAWTASSPCSA
jgi:polyisoprenoid-binding protein YceI